LAAVAPAATAAAATDEKVVASSSSWTRDIPLQAAADPSTSAEPSSAHTPSSGAAESAAPSDGVQLDEGDLLLIDELDIGGKKAKQTRPTYKVRN
jgi:hypothetical protein